MKPILHSKFCAHCREPFITDDNLEPYCSKQCGDDDFFDEYGYLPERDDYYEEDEE